ncbi:MAG: hypothetical protein JWR90_1925 [Marmoricola sp.]|jgi:hypothetical protein|nr:hypothetical protein [Marmoricola sp.]
MSTTHSSLIRGLAEAYPAQTSQRRTRTRTRGRTRTGHRRGHGRGHR